MIRKRLLCCLACCLWLSPWLSGAQQNPRYDLTFKHWGEFYLPWQDWHWWKAQGIAESGLNQLARSPRGALGIMQLMPETAKELGVDPLDPDGNIQGGIKYDAQLWRLWQKAANPTERRDLGFASYNAGAGSLERAAKLADGVPEWTTARLFLAQVTGAYAAQTIAYVERISQNYSELR